METRVERFAKDYSDSWYGAFAAIAYKAYIHGYNQCVEDDIEQDMDEWQKKLSESYSNLKETHWNLKCQLKACREKIKQLSNPTDSEKFEMYLKLKEEYAKKEVAY